MEQNTTIEKIQANTRNTSFELLRIISIILIVAHHLSVHGGYENFSFGNEYIIKALAVGGKVGVNVFMFISGYFLIKQKFSLKKYLKMEFQVIFYSVISYLILVLINYTVNNVNIFTFKELVTNFFPVLFGKYWFFTGYIIIYLLMNFLNKIIYKLSEPVLLIVIVLLFVLKPLFIAEIQVRAFFDTMNTVIEISFIKDLLPMYFIGAYFRLFSHKIFDNKLIWSILLTLSFIAMIVSNIYSVEIHNIHQPVCVLASISLFLLFKSFTIKHNKFINTVASATFGVYLIHDSLLKYQIWQNLFHCPQLASTSPWFGVLSILIVFTIFIFCTLIELGRKYAIEKPLFNLIDKIEHKIKSKRNRLQQNIQNE